MEIKGTVNRDKPLEKQPEGTSRFAQNMRFNKEGVLENDVGIKADNQNYFNDRSGGVVYFNDATVLFPHGDNAENTSAVITIFENNNRRSVTVVGCTDYNTFSAVPSRNHKDERIITYIDNHGYVRNVNIDDPISVSTPTSWLNNRNELTPEIVVAPTVDVSYVGYNKGGAMKTGKYFVALGFEIEDYSPIKWTIPQGPYVVSSYNINHDVSHSGALDANSGVALRILYNGKANKFKNVNVAVIKDVNGTVSADIVERFAADVGGDHSFIYSGNESMKAINVEDITVNRFHIHKAESLAYTDNKLYVGGPTDIDYTALDALQTTANNIEVWFRRVDTDARNVDDGDFRRIQLINTDSAVMQGLQPDEVYALNLGVQLTDGTTREFTIPGRTARAITLHRGSASFSGNEDAEIPSDMRTDDANKPIGFIEGHYYPYHAKVYQLVNTAELFTTVNNLYLPGYWENENERYPDTDFFGTVRGQRVRHHRCPSYHQLFNDSPLSNGDDVKGYTLHAEFQEINIPEELKQYIACIYFTAAKRTTSNCIVVGCSAGIPHQDDIFNSQTNLQNTLADTTKLRLYDYNLIANKIAPTFNYLKPIYRHNTVYSNNNEDVRELLWDMTTSYDSSGTTGGSAYETIEGRTAEYYAVEDASYFPEGNAATIPANIYKIATDSIVNREECLYVNLWNSLTLGDATKQSALIKTVFLLCNWTRNTYLPFNKQETMIISQMYPVDTTTAFTHGGDVFFGTEFKRLTYRFHTDDTADEVNHPTLRWQGYSPIMQHAREVSNAKGGDLSNDYNRGCIPVNDYHNPIYMDGHHNDLLQISHPHRVLESRTQKAESAKLAIRYFDANAYHDISKSKGPITNLIGVNKTLMVQTADTTWIYKVRDSLKTSEVDAYLGKAEIFTSPPKPLIESELGLGGNRHVGSHTISEYGVLFPDSESGSIFLVGDTVERISNYGLREDFKRYLKDDSIIKTAYDPDLRRFLISIHGENTGDPAYLLSYYPDKKGWLDGHTHTGVLPFVVDGKIEYVNNNANGVGNRVYQHALDARSRDLIQMVDDYEGSQRDSYVDIPIHTNSGDPELIHAVQFKTINRGTRTFINPNLTDYTVDRLLFYTRTKCSGIIELQPERAFKDRLGGALSYKDGIWRFNDIKDMIIHTVNTSDEFAYTGNRMDRPEPIDPITGTYTPDILSSLVGGGRTILDRLDHHIIISDYLVVRFIIRTDTNNRVSLTDVALTTNKL